MRGQSFLLVYVMVSAGCFPRKLKVDHRLEYKLHDPDVMLALQTRIDTTLGTNRFQLRTDPPQIPAGWSPAFSFVHASDVQLRDLGIRLISSFVSHLGDCCGQQSALRHPLLDANDEMPFIALVGALNQLNNKPRFLIHTGDAADAGSKDEAIVFLSIANRLAIPWFNVNGNHDVNFFGTLTHGDVKELVNGIDIIHGRTNFMALHGLNDFPFAARDRWSRHRPTETFQFGSNQESRSFRHGYDHPTRGEMLPSNAIPKDGWYSLKVSDSPALRLLILDTTIPDAMVAKRFPWWPLEAEGGFIKRSQYEWLLSELAAADSAREYVIVVGHHQLTKPNGTILLKVGIDESKRVPLRDILAAQPHVLAYIAGHSHQPYIREHPAATGSLWEIIAGSLHEFPQVALLITVLTRGGELAAAVQPIAGEVEPGRPFAAALAKACLGTRREERKHDARECWQSDEMVRRFLPLRSVVWR
jgi:3',5'-cyclic AMP phosphodiesterase CpdA